MVESIDYRTNETINSLLSAAKDGRSGVDLRAEAVKSLAMYVRYDKVIRALNSITTDKGVPEAVRIEAVRALRVGDKKT